MTSSPIPTKIRVIAYLCILTGVQSIIRVAVALLNGELYLGVGIAYVFIGRGILKLNSTAHSWLMAGTILGLVLLPIAIVLFLLDPGELEFFGIAYGDAPFGLNATLCGLGMCFLYWQYRVLNSTETRRLFGKT